MTQYEPVDPKHLKHSVESLRAFANDYSGQIGAIQCCAHTVLNRLAILENLASQRESALRRYGSPQTIEELNRYSGTLTPEDRAELDKWEMDWDNGPKFRLKPSASSLSSPAAAAAVQQPPSATDPAGASCNVGKSQASDTSKGGHDSRGVMDGLQILNEFTTWTPAVEGMPCPIETSPKHRAWLKKLAALCDRLATLESFFFDQDQDSHWYMIPDCLRKDWKELTKTDLDEDGADRLDARFGKFRLAGGISGISFSNPKEQK